MTPLHVLAALLFGTLAPPADDAKAQCLASCDDASATDRESCRLQCDQAARSRTAPNVVRWKRTEELGGAPPGSKNKGGTTTTTTVETPSGTTTTTESTGAKAGAKAGAGDSAPVARPAHGPPGTNAYAAMARCQVACDAEAAADEARASCKLVCLRRFPSEPRRPVFVAKDRAPQRARSASSSR